MADSTPLTPNVKSVELSTPSYNTDTDTVAVAGGRKDDGCAVEVAETRNEPIAEAEPPMQAAAWHWIATAVVTVMGAAFAYAGSSSARGSHHVVGGYPVFGLAILWAYVVNWLAFVPAYVFQTEHFYDIIGAFTYISTSIFCLVLASAVNGVAIGPRGGILAACVLVWSLRLGYYLGARVRKVGKDDRFEKLKVCFPCWLMTWTIQSLWVSLTAGAAFAAMTSQDVPLTFWDLIGGAIWIFGFGVEIIADRQKAVFRETNVTGTFISTGLWSIVRHPNYAGEILLWVGIAVFAFPALWGWQWVTLISPVFVFCLLRFVSGVPLLEKKAIAKWGEDADFQQYMDTTPRLFPCMPCI
jgi:steroid 5-alpha reductase family enzyme